MDNEKQMPKWMSSQVFKFAPESVDEQHSRIDGALIVTEGEAKGHGVHLDSEFIDTVYSFGNGSSSGVKARFGHPNMCSNAIGTFLGRWKNFRKDTVTRDDGTKASAVRADLFLSNSAADSPQGDLKAYVMGLAKDSPDMFGTSIVFTPGALYRRNATGGKEYKHTPKGEWNDEYDKAGEPTFVECEALHANDVVDEPAANDGLFSSFSNETLAGQVTEFLDLNPEVVNAFRDNEEILSALFSHNEEVKAFMERYSAYTQLQTGTGAVPQTEDKPMSKENTKPEVEVVQAGAAEPAAEEPVVAVEPAVTEEEPAVVEASADDDRTEFKRMVADFGSEIAATVFADGGSYEDGQAAYILKIENENAELRKKVETANAATGGTTAGFREAPKPKPTFEDVLMKRNK